MMSGHENNRFAGGRGGAAHQVLLLVFHLEHQRADGIDHHLQEGDVDRTEDDQEAEDQRQPRDGHMDGEDEAHRLAQVVVDAPSKPDRSNDGAEVVDRIRTRPSSWPEQAVAVACPLHRLS